MISTSSLTLTWKNINLSPTPFQPITAVKEEISKIAVSVNIFRIEFFQLSDDLFLAYSLFIYSCMRWAVNKRPVTFLFPLLPTILIVAVRFDWRQRGFYKALWQPHAYHPRLWQDNSRWYTLAFRWQISGNCAAQTSLKEFLSMEFFTLQVQATRPLSLPQPGYWFSSDSSPLSPFSMHNSVKINLNSWILLRHSLYCSPVLYTVISLLIYFAPLFSKIATEAITHSVRVLVHIVVLPENFLLLFF